MLLPTCFYVNAKQYVPRWMRILESQALIGLQPLRVPVCEDGDLDVRMVRELHCRVARMRPQQAAEVLDELALDRLGRFKPTEQEP